jgi:glycosyltransferase involved in cell wall biosynthesis
VKISVVIPVYESAVSLDQLLRAINESDPCDREVIVVDDGSSDNAAELAASLGARVIRLTTNSGPATARNMGVKAAEGEVVLFLDADVKPPPGLIAHVARRMEREPDLLALNGYYCPVPLNPGYFPAYKARYIHFLFQGKEDTQVLETPCAAVRTSALREAGGFDESYRGADVEDYELGYRLSARRPMKIDHAMLVAHHFPGFIRNARNFFRRGAMWTELYLGRRRFDAAATTASEGLLQVLGALAAAALAMTPLAPRVLAPVFILLFGAYLIGGRGFFKYLYREEGPGFALTGIFVHWANSVVIAAGAAWGVIRYSVKKMSATS